MSSSLIKWGQPNFNDFLLGRELNCISLSKKQALKNCMYMLKKFQGKRQYFRLDLYTIKQVNCPCILLSPFQGQKNHEGVSISLWSGRDAETGL